MINYCPYCGRKISRVIVDGITTCNNCQRVFDSSPYHRILAAAWLIRRQDVYDIETVQSICNLTSCEAGIVKKYVIDANGNTDKRNYLRRTFVDSYCNETWISPLCKINCKNKEYVFLKETKTDEYCSFL